MTVSVEDKRERFQALHGSGCFVLPNPWDIGSTRRLAGMGFPALATTSAGLAWSLGRQDGEVSCDEVLAHLTAICAATDLPVNADFESGFAPDPEGVAANVTRAMATGVAGLSIEDSAGRQIRPRPEATARLAAARRAIDRSGASVLLVGRSEGHFLHKHYDLADTIDRLKAYADAGADCLYAPGVTGVEEVARIVAAVAPKPVNVLMAGPGHSVADYAAAGARRVSVGGALAAAAWRGFTAAAQALADTGTLPPRG